MNTFGDYTDNGGRNPEIKRLHLEIKTTGSETNLGRKEQDEVLCWKEEYMITCNVKDLTRLMDEIRQLTGIEISRSSFPKVHKRLNDEYNRLYLTDIPVKDEYLYRSLLTEVKNKKKEGIQRMRMQEKQIHALARALGYADYEHFEEHKHPAITKTLANCEGAWYSYVRCNSGKEFILRAPVSIYPERKIMQMKMQGPNRMYTGELNADGDVLFCLLKSDQFKRLHMVLKTGLALHPKVLQGVFTGLSSAGDPIAGREVLIKQETVFEKLTPDRISIKKLMGSALEEEEAVAQYFSRNENAIVKAGVSSSFDLDDLKNK